MTPGWAALASAAPVAALVAAYAAFTLGRARRPAPDGDALAKGGGRLLGLALRDYWYWLHAPLLAAARRAGATPDGLSLAGAAVTAAAGLAFAGGWFALGGWLIVAGGAFDILDGKLARALGLARPAGAFLDSTLDRYGDWALFAGLALYYEAGWGQRLALLALGGSFMVSYARARGEALGARCREGWLQRGERFVFVAAAGVFTPLAAYLGAPYGALMLGALALVALLANATALWRVREIFRRLAAGPGAEAS